MFGKEKKYRSSLRPTDLRMYSVDDRFLPGRRRFADEYSPSARNILVFISLYYTQFTPRCITSGRTLAFSTALHHVRSLSRSHSDSPSLSLSLSFRLFAYFYCNIINLQSWRFAIRARWRFVQTHTRTYKYYQVHLTSFSQYLFVTRSLSIKHTDVIFVRCDFC